MIGFVALYLLNFTKLFSMLTYFPLKQEDRAGHIKQPIAFSLYHSSARAVELGKATVSS